VTFARFLRADRRDRLSEITRDAIAECGDCERAYALAAARYELALGLPLDPPTWEAAGLTAGWTPSAAGEA
jgi:hypothetical protein